MAMIRFRPATQTDESSQERRSCVSNNAHRHIDVEPLPMFPELGYDALMFASRLNSLSVFVCRCIEFIVATILPSADGDEEERRHLDGSESIGRFNGRTGQLDSGVDPYGWYDDKH